MSVPPNRTAAHPSSWANGEVRCAQPTTATNDRRRRSVNHGGWRQLNHWALKASPPGGPGGSALTALLEHPTVIMAVESDTRAHTHPTI